MTSAEIEKRKDPRFVTFVPLHVKVIDRKREDQIPILRVVNISCSGLHLVLASEPTKDAEMQIKIKLPPPYNSEVKGPSKLVRCEEYVDRVNHVKTYDCGFSLELSEESRSEIDQFVRDANEGKYGVFDRRNPTRSRNSFTVVNPIRDTIYSLSKESQNVQICQLAERDLDELEKVEIGAWGKEMCANREMLATRLAVFQAGMIGARVDGKLVGYFCVLKVKESLCQKEITWMGITDGGYIRGTHDPDGDCLYGVSLSVIPSAPKDIAVKLLKESGKLPIRMALRGNYFGCRIPNFHKHARHMSVEEYIKATSNNGRILDPELALYRKAKGIPLRPLPNYFPDPESLNYGVLIGWENPFYKLQKGEFPFFFERVTVDFT